MIFFFSKFNFSRAINCLCLTKISMMSAYSIASLNEDSEQLLDDFIDFQFDKFFNNSLHKIGYELNFTKYFYNYEPLRPSSEILQDLIRLNKESEELINLFFKKKRNYNNLKLN